MERVKTPNSFFQLTAGQGDLKENPTVWLNGARPPPKSFKVILWLWHNRYSMNSVSTCRLSQTLGIWNIFQNSPFFKINSSNIYSVKLDRIFKKNFLYLKQPSLSDIEITDPNILANSLSATTLSTATFSITTLSINGLFVTHCINNTQHKWLICDTRHKHHSALQHCHCVQCHFIE